VRSDTPGQGQVALRIAQLDGEILQSAEAVPAGDYSQLEFDFMGPEGGEVRLDLHAQGTGRAHWDDVELLVVADQPAGGPLQPVSDPDRIVNGGFEEPLGKPWEVYGRDSAPSEPAAPFEVAVTLNGEIIAATRPGAERWDVATRLLSPQHRYLRCGWSVSIAAESLREGENPLEAYAVVDPVRRIAVRLDSGHPRALIKDGDSIERKAP
jgi:hypothetical protein